jgi:YHS domain-containing protein
MRRLTALFAAALITITVGTSGAASAAKSSHSPALQGYCPVAYVAMGKAMKGDPKIASVHAGHRYLFANADAKKMFVSDPAKYEVAYDGWCATAVSMGKKLKSDPKLFTAHGGKTYLFSSAEAKSAFDGMPDGVIMKADAQWGTLAAK